MPGFRTGWNLPPGVTDRMIDEAAGGYDEPPFDGEEEPEEEESMAKEEYLGDGLYASFDGYQVKLRTPREHGDHEVYLEPGTLANFLAYVERLKKAPAGWDKMEGGARAND